MLSDGNANIAAKVAVNVTIAAAASAVFAVLISLFVTNKFGLTMAVQGLIAGLVSVSGGAHVIDPWMSFLIGAIAAVVLYAGQSLLLLLRIDDACDTAVVHGFCGLWGLWAVGIFCTDDNIRYAGYPVRDEGCRTAKQFGIQVVASLAVVAWVAVISVGVWLLTYLTIGLRVSYEDEDDGLDIGYHGVRMKHALHTSRAVSDEDEDSALGGDDAVSAETMYHRGMSPSARAAESAKLAAAVAGKNHGVVYQEQPLTMVPGTAIMSPRGVVPAHFQLSGTPVVVGRPEVYAPV